jgi:hypothetical protein
MMNWVWKEAFDAYFTTFFQHFRGGTEESHENLSQDGVLSGEFSNSSPPEYESRDLTTTHRRVMNTAHISHVLR